MARVGLPGLDPDQPASALQAGERHALAMARAWHFGTRVLVVDEPTAPLTVAQHGLVMQLMMSARAEGRAVVYVTNNPRYAHLVGDRFLLLGGGQVAGDLTRADVDANDLVRLMTGGDELTAFTTALTQMRGEGP
jgi:simple sugar transport system ATP-binding protein